MSVSLYTTSVSFAYVLVKNRPIGWCSHNPTPPPPLPPPEKFKNIKKKQNKKTKSVDVCVLHN